MNNTMWWGKPLLIGIVSVFFLIFGIDALIASYRTTSPHIFIMGFFSSSLIILISVVGIMYPVVMYYNHSRHGNEDDTDDER